MCASSLVVLLSVRNFGIWLTRTSWVQVQGVVFKADNNGALIDIGAKAPAYLPIQEACILKLKSVEEVGLFPGSEEEFAIIRDDDDNGRMILSLKKIQFDLCWERSAQMLADDVVVRGTVGQSFALKP
jgi:small subunit ribosomal protein S1